MEFRLNVVRGRAAPKRLVVEAPTLNDAKDLAVQQGFTVLSATAVRPLGRLSSLIRSDVSVFERRELTIFVEQLYALLQAGLSVIESLETLQKGTKGKAGETIGHIIDQLRQGKTFSESLAQQGNLPALLIAMVKSSELTSDLPKALSRFLDHQQRTEQVRHQITSVSLYPLLLMAVGGSVILFLLFYVMPRFARVFESMNNLPWSAQAMVTWGHLLKAHGALIGLGVLGLPAVLLGAWLVPANRVAMMKALLRSTVISKHLRIYFLARWYRTIGMLVEGGIPLPQAVTLAGQVLPDALRERGLHVVLEMQQGQSPSIAFSRANMSTPASESLLLAGERSGDVGIMLRRAAEFHENEVARSIERTMKIIEPLVMTFIGVGVGTVVILMYMPIFELASAIQ